MPDPSEISVAVKSRAIERQNENAVIEKSSRRKKISVISVASGVIGTVLIMAGGMLFGILGAVWVLGIFWITTVIYRTAFHIIRQFGSFPQINIVLSR